jgi:hypothetical protein
MDTNELSLLTRIIPLFIFAGNSITSTLARLRPKEISYFRLLSLSSYFGRYLLAKKEAPNRSINAKNSLAHNHVMVVEVAHQPF